MILHILYMYVIVAYIVGAVLFVVDVSGMLYQRSKAIKLQPTTDVDLSSYINVMPAICMGAAMTLIAPLVAWHGVLHYAAIVYANLANKPVKFWL